MIEIGNALRTARERQGLELAEVERQTRIRERYLGALEDERFELLPAHAYAKGFLRVYADFLGLDGRLIVSEFNARFAEAAEAEPPPPTRASVGRVPSRRRGALVLSGAALALVGVLVWRLDSGGPKVSSPAPPTTATHPRKPVAPPVLRPPAAHPARLVLRARGPCWLRVRAGSATGPVLYESTLRAGGLLRYTLDGGHARLWVRIGAPWNLELSLNGAPAPALPHRPANVVVDRGGVHPA